MLVDRTKGKDLALDGLTIGQLIGLELRDHPRTDPVIIGRPRSQTAQRYPVHPVVGIYQPIGNAMRLLPRRRRFPPLYPTIRRQISDPSYHHPVRSRVLQIRWREKNMPLLRANLPLHRARQKTSRRSAAGPRQLAQEPASILNIHHSAPALYSLTIPSAGSAKDHTPAYTPCSLPEKAHRCKYHSCSS